MTVSTCTLTFSYLSVDKEEEESRERKGHTVRGRFSRAARGRVGGGLGSPETATESSPDFALSEMEVRNVLLGRLARSRPPLTIFNSNDGRAIGVQKLCQR